MKSSHQKRRSNQKSESYQRLNADSILTSQRSPHKSVVYQKAILQIRQNSMSKKNRFLIELPKIYPLHKKLLNIKSKDFEIVKYNDRRFQLRGFKFIHQMQQMQESTIEFEDMQKSSITLKKKESTATLHNNFSQIILKLNNINSLIPLKNYKIKAYVEQGNNSRLIKQLLRKRNSIKLVSDKNQAQLVWTRFSDYNSLDKYSKFVESTITYNNSTRNQDDYIQCYRKITDLQMSNNFINSNKNLQIANYFIHNHLKNHEEISDKKNLFKNIRSYCQKMNMNESMIIPKTFHIDLNTSKQGLAEIKINEIFQTKKYNQSNFFVVKPGEDTNRGEGITVVKGKQNVLNAVKALNKIGKSSLIQEYINPLLYRNRKFDIRCYVLVTSICGQLRAYWYKQGYLRTCCKQFNYDPSNLYGHLTNDAVQKKHKDYGKYEQANKLSYSDLQIILSQTQRSKDQVIKDMKNLAKHSIKSVQNKLKGQKNIIGFEIFGYDFLIDKDGKVWLIQINTNPCLQFSGSLLSRIIWHMVDNSIKIAIDPFLQRDFRKQYQNYLDINRYQCII